MYKVSWYVSIASYRDIIFISWQILNLWALGPLCLIALEETDSIVYNIIYLNHNFIFFFLSLMWIKEMANQSIRRVYNHSYGQYWLYFLHLFLRMPFISLFYHISAMTISYLVLTWSIRVIFAKSANCYYGLYSVPKL